jgi:hypothetical protein
MPSSESSAILEEYRRRVTAALTQVISLCMYYLMRSDDLHIRSVENII